MNRITPISMSLIIFSIFTFTQDVLSWDTDTHEIITKYAAENSALSSANGDCLKNVGLKEGIYEVLEWGVEKQVFEWLQQGSVLEDEWKLLDLFGKMRSKNHFHNPLKDWDEAGLDNIFTGQSSLLWAQDGNEQSGHREGDWSWQKTREYYHLALTALTENERQEYLARTFRGLGHQVHLIQDKAVPTHVRNDAHPLDSIFKRNQYGGYYFETWAKETTTEVKYEFDSSKKN